MVAFKPERYNSVSPYLVVKDAAATITFLTEVFGGKLLQKFPDDKGRLMHAEVRVDDTVIMLGDSSADWTPVPAYVHVYVPDVDATYQRALRYGATSVQEPVKKQDADKRGGVRDACGTTWWIATKVE
jgi:uncharacterized glyoxalase superfamily protein PhnB